MKITINPVLSMETLTWVANDGTYEYSGAVELLCGPTGAEKSIAGQQSSMSTMLNANYATSFAGQDQILGHLNNILSPTAEAGPDQQGFGANELADLNTSAREGVGQNYAKASQSLNNTLAARGGGDSFMPNGAADQLRSGLASSAANESSKEELGIDEANYGQGRTNYNNAVGGLENVAGQYNPNATANAATGASQAAFGDQQAIQQSQDAWIGDVTGLVGGLAGAAATAYAGHK
jgi:hypothetical protein